MFERKIKEKNSKFKYCNIINLMEVVKKELGTEENSLLKEFYLLKREEYEKEFELYELMKIYDKLTEKIG